MTSPFESNMKTEKVKPISVPLKPSSPPKPEAGLVLRKPVASHKGAESGKNKQLTPSVNPLPPPSKQTEWIVTVCVFGAALLAVSVFGITERLVTTELQEKMSRLQDEIAFAENDHISNQAKYESAKSRPDDALHEAESATKSVSAELDETKRLLKQAITELETARQVAITVVTKTEKIESQSNEIDSLLGKIAELNMRQANMESIQPVWDSEKESAQPRDQFVKSNKQEDTRTTMQRAPLLNQPAWIELGEFKTGQNKGKWYFKAPDGFLSQLYPSRAQAVHAAELRARHQ